MARWEPQVARDRRRVQFSFASRGNEEYAAKLRSALRYEFGGHKEKSADKQEAA